MTADTERRFTVGGSGAAASSPVSQSYDPAIRRRTVRRGRERGCWLYIPADELVAAGFSLNDPPPWYRVWGTPRGVMVRLYRKGNVE